MTPEAALLEREQLVEQVRFHRRAATRAKRALDRLEADCARHGIRLIREPIRARGGRDQHHAGTDSFDR